MNTSPTSKKNEPPLAYPQSELHNFSKSDFTTSDFLFTFGCFQMEKRIMNEINDSLHENRMPEFNGDWSCICLDNHCVWDKESIITRLKESGIWQALEAKLAYRKWQAR